MKNKIFKYNINQNNNNQSFKIDANYTRKLKSDLSDVKLENQRKDDLINELSSFPCIEKSAEGILDKNSGKAELTVFRLKLNEMENELLEKISENRSHTGIIKILKSDNQFLQEVNARQKATLSSFKNDMETLHKFNENSKNRADEYLETINMLKKQIEFYKNELAIKDNRIRELNEYIEDINVKNRDSNSQVEKLLVNVFEGEELKGLKEAVLKVRAIILANQNLKFQLNLSQTQILSFTCEQKLSRETIVRLSKELKFEKSIRVGMEDNIYKLMQEINSCKKLEENNNQEINCLRDQASKLREALIDVQKEDFKKTATISKLVENSENFNPLAESIDYLEIFINKAEEIIRDFYNGKTSVEKDVEWVLKCLKKLIIEMRQCPQKEE